MKHILNNASQGTDIPWVTLDENGVHYSGLVSEVLFTFGSVDSHNKAKTDAVVGDICYYGNTPIGIVVIKNEDKVKIMSLFELKEDCTNSPDHTAFLTWGVFDDTTNVTDINNGKANTAALVALGSDYKAAVACSLYSTDGTSKGDWYLPAKQELEDMQWSTNKTTIQTSLNSLDTFALSLGEDNGYWSSTESYSISAYFLRTYDGTIDYYDKDNSNLVRAFCEL